MHNGTLERTQWDPAVIVSFQENGWMDTQTNICGLKNMEPMNDCVREKGLVGVMFQDNLSSYRTDAYRNSFNKLMQEFVKPCNYPPNLTSAL
jgi:hypothetical protein